MNYYITSSAIAPTCKEFAPLETIVQYYPQIHTQYPGEERECSNELVDATTNMQPLSLEQAKAQSPS